MLILPFEMVYILKLFRVSK